MIILKLTLIATILAVAVHCKPQYSSNWPNRDDTINIDTEFKKPWFLEPTKNKDSITRIGSNNGGLDLDFGNNIGSGRNTNFGSGSNNNFDVKWSKDNDEFFKEANANFENQKTAKTIFGIVAGVMIGILVLVVVSVLACCFIPCCMCYKARSSRNTQGVVYQAPNPNSTATQPLYPVQSQAASYPVQGSQIQVQMGGYGPPPVYPFPQNNATQQSANWTAPVPDKQAPYNPYYGGNGQQNPNLPPYPSN